MMIKNPTLSLTLRLGEILDERLDGLTKSLLRIFRVAYLCDKRVYIGMARDFLYKRPSPLIDVVIWLFTINPRLDTLNPRLIRA